MKVAIILAPGFEEIEAITCVDILRRADIDAQMVGLESTEVTGTHGIQITADTVLGDINANDYQMIVLPGGLPGAKHLAQSEKLAKVLNEFDRNNAKIAAICAAPWALKTAGVLGDHYTCYPGFDAQVNQAGYTDSVNVVVDQNIITSRGPATAMEFALNLVKELLGNEKFESLKKDLLFK